MVRVRCIRADSEKVLELGSVYYVDSMADIDAYVHIRGGRYIGMYPSKWFEEAPDGAA
ncbi:hypothetical protein [Escherichia phage AV102]|nr:hypothetical protein [Escherichia phage AV102]